MYFLLIIHFSFFLRFKRLQSTSIFLINFLTRLVTILYLYIYLYYFKTRCVKLQNYSHCRWLWYIFDLENHLNAIVLTQLNYGIFGSRRFIFSMWYHELWNITYILWNLQTILLNSWVRTASIILNYLFYSCFWEQTHVNHMQTTASIKVLIIRNELGLENTTFIN